MTFAILALVAGLFPAGLAIADDQTVADPDDVAGPIDVERLVQSHYFEYVLYRVVGFERWPTEALAGGEMVFKFDVSNSSNRGF